MSNIKGGGRAVLKEETENALVDLIMELKVGQIPTKEHDRKRERRRFLKKLVSDHEQQTLQSKYNSKDNSKASTQPAASQKRVVTGDPKAKVRIELTQAKYHSKKGTLQDGAKKVMVLPRSTTIADVLKQAKQKLRLNATRCFVVEKKQEFDLLHDLMGVQDGATVYVAKVAGGKAMKPDSKKGCSKKGKEGKDDNKAAADDDDADDDDNGTETAATAMRDPLESVKQVYRYKAVTQRKRRQKDHSKTATFLSTYPTISDHFEKLPKLSERRAKLPAAKCREEVLDMVDKHRVVIICGATGSGKSTNVPHFLYEGMLASGNADAASIMVTQPRRVAATSLAQHVAKEMNSPSGPGKPGSTVGYHVRLDRAVTSTTKLVYCTIGILVRMLVCPQENADDAACSQDGGDVPPLSQYTHIVIDEVHERDLNTDFCLTMLRTVLVRNPTIRVILMSATASASLFVNYFSRFNPPIINIPGRTFPVDIRWLEDCNKVTGSRYLNQGAGNRGKGGTQDETDEDSRQQREASAEHFKLSPRAYSKIDYDYVSRLIRQIVRHPTHYMDGSTSPSCGILVFLPGKMEIEQLEKILGKKRELHILKLHSAISRRDQQKVFDPAPHGAAKVVLATNIAETSLTIPDITHVIDSGYVKESRFNSSTRIRELVTVWTSLASAKQRSGRAGRTQPGVCWRLYSEEFATTDMLAQTTPEIMRSPLDELMLQVCLLFEHHRDGAGNGSTKPSGLSPFKFLQKVPEPPPKGRLQEACLHLLEVGGIAAVPSPEGENNEHQEQKQPQQEKSSDSVLYRLTPLGYHLSRLPMDAKVGKVLIVGCILQCLEPALTIAAELSHAKSIFFGKFSNLSFKEWQPYVVAREVLVRDGFGGVGWPGGTVKGDLIAVIAAYNAWKARRDNPTQQRAFCVEHALDQTALREIDRLREQFRGGLQEAGFVTPSCNENSNDAMLTSCCLVAGLYPNIATLLRPRKGKLGQKGGRLFTKDGDEAMPSSSSFQRKRVHSAAETGRDAYAVYHAKHRSLNSASSAQTVYLQEVNFVSRFSLMLFGGDMRIDRNALVVDEWLKFKCGEDNDVARCILIQELRNELDRVLLSHIAGGGGADDDAGDEGRTKRNKAVLDLVRRMLQEE